MDMLVRSYLGEPVRIQRRRTKGWRMPKGAVYVGRPTRWGNRWRVDEPLGREFLWDAETVTELYRLDITKRGYDDESDRQRLAAFVEPLRGHDLVCWCPLDQPCHADSAGASHDPYRRCSTDAWHASPGCSCLPPPTGQGPRHRARHRLLVRSLSGYPPTACRNPPKDRQVMTRNE